MGQSIKESHKMDMAHHFLPQIDSVRTDTDNHRLQYVLKATATLFLTEELPHIFPDVVSMWQVTCAACRPEYANKLKPVND